MVDYGRPLRFGIGIGPAAADFEPSLDLARLADDMGLDYLAVQDRPYQPAQLDVWTLLTYLLAHTESISVVPDVANLRVRPPALLAKAAASLAAMADGRVQLGVGAGAPPPQALPPQTTPTAGGAKPGGMDLVAFTEEAVGTLRRALRGEAVDAGSARHRVPGSGRIAGPTPPDPVEVWIGAAKPRMLSLVGRLGEGWVCPMNTDVPPQEAARGHALIDVAASAAGRDPGEVRRIYNVLGSIDSTRPSRGLAGTVNVWIDALSRWAVGMGFDTFVFWPEGDQPAQLKVFADEVVPGVRDRVAALREHPVTHVL
ncbi:MAG TPA: LLM class flavin-dependent oxidoreductase [Actinocrinis sp.]|nr:LLM class flavin-dependent oxidoreductase [Actinocrinis sp.]